MHVSHGNFKNVQWLTHVRFPVEQSENKDVRSNGIDEKAVILCIHHDLDSTNPESLETVCS